MTIKHFFKYPYAVAVGIASDFADSVKISPNWEKPRAHNYMLEGARAVFVRFPAALLFPLLELALVGANSAKETIEFVVSDHERRMKK